MTEKEINKHFAKWEHLNQIRFSCLDLAITISKLSVAEAVQHKYITQQNKEDVDLFVTTLYDAWKQYKQMESEND